MLTLTYSQPEVSQPAPVPHVSKEVESAPLTVEQLEHTSQTQAVQDLIGEEMEAHPEEEKAEQDAIWNQDDEDEDDDEDDDLNNQQEEREGEAAEAQESKEGEGDKKEAADGYKRDYNRRANQRGRRGYGPRGGRYRQNKYEDYNEKDYQVYEHQYHQQQQPYSNKGFYNEQRYKSDQAYNQEGTYEGQKRDFYNRPHRANRGRGRGGKDFRPRDNEEEAQKDTKQEEKQFDDDGFAIVNKKIYTKPAKKGNKKAKPAPQ